MGTLDEWIVQLATFSTITGIVPVQRNRKIYLRSPYTFTILIFYYTYLFMIYFQQSFAKTHMFETSAFLTTIP